MFHEAWWLDIVTEGRWDATEITSGGRTVGRMPYYLVKRLTGPAILMPPLTHFLGPAIEDKPGAANTRWLHRLDVTHALLRKLPRFTHFHQKFHRGVTDVVPFQAERFDTGVQFTFEIAPHPEAQLWAALRDKQRNVIRRAQERHEVEPLNDPEEFARFYFGNLRERRVKSWFRRDMLIRLVGEALARDAGVSLGVRDGEGQLLAAVFCTHDRQTTYYSFSTRRVDAGNGVVPMLIWEQVRRAAAAGRVFDFDGISTDGSIRLFAGFGGTTSPRYIAKRSIRFDLVRAARNRFGLHANTFGG